MDYFFAPFRHTEKICPLVWVFLLQIKNTDLTFYFPQLDGDEMT